MGLSPLLSSTVLPAFSLFSNHSTTGNTQLSHPVDCKGCMSTSLNSLKVYKEQYFLSWGEVGEAVVYISIPITTSIFTANFWYLKHSLQYQTSKKY